MKPSAKQAITCLQATLLRSLFLSKNQRNLLEEFSGILRSYYYFQDISQLFHLIIIIYINHLRMKQESNNNKMHRSVKNGLVALKIKMNPKSLEIQIPIDWEVNKLKCLVARMLPRMLFDMFHFEHDGEALAGTLTFKKILEIDQDQECIDCSIYVIHFVKNEVQTNEYQSYYSKKMVNLFETMQSSPFQPHLHPNYFALRQQISQKQMINIERLRENIANMNNILQNQEQQRAQQQNQNGLGLGLGMMGQQGNQGGIWNLRGFIFRICQIFFIFAILNIISEHLSAEHFIVVGIILIIYFCIQYLRKRNEENEKNNIGNNANNLANNLNNNNANNMFVQQDNASISAIKQEIEQAAQLQNQKQINNEKKVSQYEKIYLRIVILLVEKICLIVQVVISFFLSLFPNWNIRTHRNTFKNIYESIEFKLKLWNQKIDESKQAQKISTMPKVQVEIMQQLKQNHHYQENQQNPHEQ